MKMHLIPYSSSVLRSGDKMHRIQQIIVAGLSLGTNANDGSALHNIHSVQ